MDEEAVVNAGAPRNLTIGLQVYHNGSLRWDVVWANKRPTRMPESIFFQFRPALSSHGWMLQVSSEKIMRKGGRAWRQVARHMCTMEQGRRTEEREGTNGNRLLPYRHSSPLCVSI